MTHIFNAIDCSPHSVAEAVVIHVSYLFPVVCGVVVGGAGIGGVALIRTSLQLLWHFHSGYSLCVSVIYKKNYFTWSCIIHGTGVNLTPGDISSEDG